MKRALDDEADGAADMVAEQAAPAESHVIRMWMQNNHCGTIIGKGGVNIKAIREQSDCKVQVSELAPGAAERLVTTTGSIAGINKAAELMIEVLEEQAAADPAAATEGERTHTLKLILSNNQVGGIIGKAGVVIKAMRDESGAVIKVDPAQTMQNERVVSLSGTKAALIKAHMLTAEKIASMPPDDDSKASKHQRTNPPGAPGAPPGYAMQQQYAPQGYAQQGYAQQGYAPQPGYSQYAPQPAYGQHPPQPGYGQPPQGYQQQQQQQQQQQYPPQPGYSPYAPQPGGYAPQGYAPPTQGGPTADGGHEQMVPVALVGRLIGKAGSAIKELREMSGANIKVNSECEPGTQERKVVVSGTPDAVQYALGLIAQELAQGP